MPRGRGRGGRGRGGRGGRGGSHSKRKNDGTRVVHTYKEALKDRNQSAEESSSSEDEGDYVLKTEEPDYYQSLLSMLPQPRQYQGLLEARKREQEGKEEEEEEEEEGQSQEEKEEQQHHPSEEQQSGDEQQEESEQGSDSDATSNEEDDNNDEQQVDDDEEDGNIIQNNDHRQEKDEEHNGDEEVNEEELLQEAREVDENDDEQRRLDALKIARSRADPTTDVYLQHYQYTSLDESSANQLEKSRLKFTNVELPFSARALGLENWNITQPIMYGTSDSSLFTTMWEKRPPVFQTKDLQKPSKNRKRKEESLSLGGISVVDLFNDFNVKRKVAEEWAVFHSDIIRCLSRAGVDVSKLLDHADSKLQPDKVGLSDIRRKRKRMAELSDSEENTNVPIPKETTAAYMSPLQRTVFESVSSYRDLFFYARNVNIETQLRSVLALHVTNHITKARELELKHTSKLRTMKAQRRSNRLEKTFADATNEGSKFDSKQDEPANHCQEMPSFKDQGFTRPRVLVLAPFRHTALQFIRMMMRLLPDREWQHKARFFQEFSDPDAEEGSIAHEKNEQGVADWIDDAERDGDDISSVHGAGVISEIRKAKERKTSSKDKRPPGAKVKRPLDFEKTFEGNLDDAFRIGISIARKSVRLYSEFYHADIIVASPLGLRINIGSELEEIRDTDFLSCIEMAVVLQADVVYMQNWSHLKEVFTGLNKMPKDMHDADFSRIREIFLDGFAKNFRQTILLSDRYQPEMHSLLRNHCHNIRGCAVVKGQYQGSITKIIPTVKQVFHRLSGQTLNEVDENRFEYFTKILYPQLRAAATSDTDMQPYTLIFVPSYFDFVRVRNFLNKEDVDVAPISEYSPDDDVSRARTMFYQGRLATIVTTERFYFYRRLRIRGIRHIIFYSVPTLSHFYSEFLNLVEEATSQSIPTSSITLYSRYEKVPLERVVGTDRVTKMVDPSSKSTFLFT